MNILKKQFKRLISSRLFKDDVISMLNIKHVQHILIELENNDKLEDMLLIINEILFKILNRFMYFDLIAKKWKNCLPYLQKDLLNVIIMDFSLDNIELIKQIREQYDLLIIYIISNKNERKIISFQEIDIFLENM